MLVASSGCGGEGEQDEDLEQVEGSAKSPAKRGSSDIEPGLTGRNDLLFYESFSSSNWASHWNGAAVNATRVGSGYRGAGLRVRIPAASHYGTNITFDFSAQGLAEPEEVYFRYYLKFGSNWNPAVSGKLPGLSHINSSTGQGKGCKAVDGNDGWSARMMWRPGDAGTDVGYYVYHADMLSPGDNPSNTCGDGFIWSDAVGYAPTARNRWICIEGHMKLNDPSASNGVLRGWVNGKPAYSNDTFRFRKVSGWKIEDFWADIYYGGKPTAPSTMDVYLDSVVLAKKRIGCDPSPCDPTWEPGAENQLFKDMPPGSFGYDSAKKLYAQGITHGCRDAPNRMFCGGCELPRDQMAAFIVRAAGWPNVNPATPSFSDVPKSHLFYRAIETLKVHGVTYGCEDGKYCPDDLVTRGQMAAFLTRALGWPVANPGTQSFSDVPKSHTFYKAIETLYAQNVTNGCGGGKFCPESPVTRAQMAIFLVRAFKL
jgi:hypothetical protein